MRWIHLFVEWLNEITLFLLALSSDVGVGWTDEEIAAHNARDNINQTHHLRIKTNTQGTF